MNELYIDPTSTVMKLDDRYQYSWRIPDFRSKWEPSGQQSPLSSPDFYAGEMSGQPIKWHVKLTCADGKIRAELIRISPTSKQYCGYSVDIFIGTEDEPRERRLGGAHALTLAELYENANIYLAPSQSLRINVILTGGAEFHHPDFMEDQFSKLLKSRQFSDFIIQVGEEELGCHKAILAARSPVFERMLSTQMDESVTSKMKIEDMNLNAVLAMLRFIYTGRFRKVQPADWEPLIHGSEKYDLPQLKSSCFVHLVNRVTAENFGDVFLLADRYNASQDIRESLKMYQEKNMTELMTHAAFRTLVYKNWKTFYPEDDFAN